MEINDSHSRYRHVLKYAGLFGSVQGLTIFLALVRNKIVTVLLGSEGLGLSSLLNSTIKLVTDATSLGLGVSAVKQVSTAFEAGDKEAVNRSVLLIRSWSLLAGLLGMSVCILGSRWLSQAIAKDSSYTLAFIVLSVVVLLSAMTGGEMAILKATHRLKQLARMSVYGIVASLLLTTPMFYFWRMDGIVPSLVTVAVIQMVLATAFSYRFYAPRFSFSRKLLGEGGQMVRLGLFFVIAGVLASLTDFVVRWYLAYFGDYETVGLYNSGYMLTVIYGGMIFSSLDSDFFPRISAIRHAGAELYESISRQIEVSMLMTCPLVMGLIVAMPILIPFLFKSDFLTVLTMAQLSAMSLFLRSVYLPMEYVPLSRGDGLSFFILELFSCVMLALGVVIGYQTGSFTGIGMGILAGSMIETVFVVAFSLIKYRYRLSGKIIRFAAVQALFLLVAFGLTMIKSGWIYWLAGIVAVALAMTFSWSNLRKDLRS